MKRLLALLLTVGILTAIDPVRLVVAQDKDKDEKKDKDKDKDKKEDKDKDKDKKEDKDKDKDKDKAKTADKPLTEEQKKELEALSGTFVLVEFEQDGKKKGADDLKKMKVTQKGAEWTFTMGDDSTQGKDTPFPDKTPKEIDSVYTNGPARDKVVKGIYKIEGDTITYCWADPGKDRPKDFTTKADSGLTVMKLKKAPAEEKDKDKAKDKDKDEKKDKDKDKKDEKDKDKDKDKKDEKDKDKKDK